MQASLFMYGDMLILRLPAFSSIGCSVAVLKI